MSFSIRMLLLAFGFGIMTLLFFLLSYIWLAFIFLGLFSVSSLNAIRSYISHHAENKSTVFGIFYGGTAVSGALGALLTGYRWSDYGVTFATLTSITGATIVFLLLLTRSNAQLK